MKGKLHPYEEPILAIQFVLDNMGDKHDNHEFLKAWNEGDWAAIDDEWPEWREFLEKCQVDLTPIPYELSSPAAFIDFMGELFMCLDHFLEDMGQDMTASAAADEGMGVYDIEEAQVEKMGEFLNRIEAWPGFDTPELILGPGARIQEALKQFGLLDGVLEDEPVMALELSVADQQLLTKGDLAEALECFHNPAIGAMHGGSPTVACISQGLSHVAQRLRE